LTYLVYDSNILLCWIFLVLKALIGMKVILILILSGIKYPMWSVKNYFSIYHCYLPMTINIPMKRNGTTR